MNAGHREESMRGVGPLAAGLMGGMLVLAPESGGRCETRGSMTRQGSYARTLFPALQGDRFGYVDRTGRFVIQPQFDSARNFAEEMACVELDGKWGFIDPTGRLVIPPQFDWAYDFYHGRARVGRGLETLDIDQAGTAPCCRSR